MSTDDRIEDFNPSTSHLGICNVNKGSVVCNRACHTRLYILAVRTEALLNPVADDAPECEGHREQQHRDGKPPWCSRCGWFRAKAAVPAQKIGKSAEERLLASSGHVPWSPDSGYHR